MTAGTQYKLERANMEKKTTKKNWRKSSKFDLDFIDSLCSDRAWDEFREDEVRISEDEFVQKVMNSNLGYIRVASF